MAITNYSELQSSIADWLARGDLATVIPDFITLAEARLKKDLFGGVFEIDAALVTDPNATDPRKVALPADFVAPIKLELVEGSAITLLLWQTPVSMAYSTIYGRPIAWCTNGADIDLDRPADAAYALTFRYLCQFALSTGAPTNWLLTNYPNIYLAASLAEAYLYIKNTDGASMWDQRAGALINGLNRTSAKSKSGAVLTVETALMRRRSASTAALISGDF